MNTSNPFDSHGTAQAQIHKSRTRLRIAVFAAFTLSLLVLVPLLVQGCKRQEEVVPPVDTNAPPVAMEDTNGLPTDLIHSNLNLPPLAPIGSNVMTPVAPLPVAPETVVAPPAAGTEYTVVKGDSFFTIGKKFGVSTKQMQEANPGVDSSRLKIGQKLNVPAATPAAVTATGTVEATTSQTYKVKSGDTLMKIAKQHGTSYKAIKAANGLTTDKIKVGQVLKIPVKETAPAIAPVVEPAPAAPVPVLPLPPVSPTPTH